MQNWKRDWSGFGVGYYSWRKHIGKRQTHTHTCILIELNLVGGFFQETDIKAPPDHILSQCSAVQSRVRSS